MIAALLLAGLTTAAALPVGPSSLQLGVGVAGLRDPVVELDAAAGDDDDLLVPFVSVQAALRGPRLTVQGGLQLQRPLASWFLLRGAVAGGAFVTGGAEGGVVGSLDVDAGFVVGPVTVFVGPRLTAAASLHDGRVSPGAHVAVVVELVDHLAVVADASGAYDLGGVYGHPGRGAVAGLAVAGLRLSL